eukprot:2245931-Rhodomonas_salina.1
MLRVPALDAQALDAGRLLTHPCVRAVKVDRQKSKKTTSYSFELFRLKERDIPIEVLEIPTQVTRSLPSSPPLSLPPPLSRCCYCSLARSLSSSRSFSLARSSSPLPSRFLSHLVPAALSRWADEALLWWGAGGQLRVGAQGAPLRAGTRGPAPRGHLVLHHAQGGQGASHSPQDAREEACQRGRTLTLSVCSAERACVRDAARACAMRIKESVRVCLRGDDSACTLRLSRSLSLLTWSVFWSPAGHHVVLAGMKSLNGILNFFNADDMEAMCEDEHFMCTVRAPTVFLLPKPGCVRVRLRLLADEDAGEDADEEEGHEHEERHGGGDDDDDDGDDGDDGDDDDDGDDGDDDDGDDDDDDGDDGDDDDDGDSSARHARPHSSLVSLTESGCACVCALRTSAGTLRG